MPDLRSRLITCMAAVFPELTEVELPIASVASVSAWDSMATVTLVALVQEEFGVEVDPDALDQFVSFELVLDYLRSNGVAP